MTASPSDERRDHGPTAFYTTTRWRLVQCAVMYLRRSLCSATRARHVLDRRACDGVCCAAPCVRTRRKTWHGAKPDLRSGEMSGSRQRGATVAAIQVAAFIAPARAVLSTAEAERSVYVDASARSRSQLRDSLSPHSPGRVGAHSDFFLFRLFTKIRLHSVLLAASECGHCLPALARKRRLLSSET